MGLQFRSHYFFFLIPALACGGGVLAMAWRPIGVVLGAMLALTSWQARDAFFFKSDGKVVDDTTTSATSPTPSRWPPC